MRYLLIMRHGKSDWSTETGQDHDRPLARRGVKAAKAMGRFITEAGFGPDLIVSSTATRALTTAELAREAGEWRCAIQTTEHLYASTPGTVLGIIQDLADTVERVLITGHEPTWSSLTTGLVGGGRFRFPTAAVACIAFEAAGWRHVAPGRGDLIWFMPPRLIT